MPHQDQTTNFPSERLLNNFGAWHQAGQPGELFYNVVHAYQQATNAPLSLCIQAALGIGAFLQQGLIELDSPTGHVTSPSLLLFGVLEPASGKSSIMDRFTAPINKFIDAHILEQRALSNKYNQAQDLWERTQKKLIRDLSKAEAEAAVQIAEAEVEAEAEEDEQEQIESKKAVDATIGSEIDNPKYQATMKRVNTLQRALKNHLKNAPSPPAFTGLGILSEATPAAIPKFIKDNHIQSLAIVTAEAEEFLSKGIKNQSSILNKGFSGEKTSKHLATRGDESYNIPITAIVFGQPYIMEKAFGGDNNRMRGTGTVSRILFTNPPPTTRHQRNPLADTIFKTELLPQTYIADPDTEKRYCQWTTEILNQNVALFESGGSHRRLKLSRNALDMWYRGRAELELELDPGGHYAEFRDHGKRLPEQWLRVSLVIHGYNQPEQDEISVETLSLAIGLVNSFSTEFQTLFRQISPEEQDVAKLREWINDKLAKGYRHIGKSLATTSSPLRPVARLDNALAILARNNEIQIGKFPSIDQNGRLTKPIIMIDLNPGLPEDQTALNSAIHEARMLNHHS